MKAKTRGKMWQNSLAGGISVVISRQQIREACAQRAEALASELERRSRDRRVDAFADFSSKVRAFRNSIRPHGSRALDVFPRRHAPNISQAAEGELAGMSKALRRNCPVRRPEHRSFLDDPKERVQGLAVGEPSDRRHRASSTAQAAAVRRAKSAKLAGAAPIAFPTSLLSREP